MTTVLLPAAVGVACIAFVATVAYRRKLLGAPGSRMMPESASSHRGS